jgi:hypothetical protein
VLTLLLTAAAVVATTGDHTVDVDLNTGRVRTQTRYCFLVLSDRVADTEFSNLIGSTEKEPMPRWVHDSSRGVLGLEHVHYQYHGVRYQLEELCMRWQTDGVPLEEQRHLALFALKLLREQRFSDLERLLDMSGKESVATMNSER